MTLSPNSLNLAITAHNHISISYQKSSSLLHISTGCLFRALANHSKFFGNVVFSGKAVAPGMDCLIHFRNYWMGCHEIWVKRLCTF